MRDKAEAKYERDESSSESRRQHMIPYQTTVKTSRHPRLDRAIVSLGKQFVQSGIQMWQSSSPASQSNRRDNAVHISRGGESVRRKQKRVFLVDDHQAVREGVRRLLELDPRITVVGEAENVNDCYEKLEAQTVDVVLMDINLPDGDGIQATEQLKAKYPDLKIVILSSFGVEHLNKAIKAGADGYLLKTAGKTELINAVIQAASGHAPIIDSKLTVELLDGLTEPESPNVGQGPLQ